MTGGEVEIFRVAEGWQDRARAYKVVIDRRVVGQIRRGETMRFEVDPGEHAVRLAIDWVGSPEEPAVVADGESVRFVARPASRRNALRGVIDSFRHRDRWIVLERDE